MIRRSCPRNEMYLLARCRIANRLNFWALVSLGWTGILLLSMWKASANSSVRIFSFLFMAKIRSALECLSSFITWLLAFVFLFDLLIFFFWHGLHSQIFGECRELMWKKGEGGKLERRLYLNKSFHPENYFDKTFCCFTLGLLYQKKGGGGEQLYREASGNLWHLGLATPLLLLLRDKQFRIN